MYSYVYNWLAFSYDTVTQVNTCTAVSFPYLMLTILCALNEGYLNLWQT